ncbi:6-bladed beta-propeller [Parabacteroides sp. APC149_11_2_Y6]
MKKSKAISVMVLLMVMAGCTGRNKQFTDDVITVDVNASYPERELILQDIMDVEYVPLETTDEFITHGYVESVGKHFFLVRNRNDGDIFIFDRTGKGIRKINRLGQGAEEYSQLTEIILYEDNDEMFVKDNPARKILVYDLSGNFKRSFKFANTGYYNYLFNYDRNHLICYNSFPTPKENEQACHLLISKQDGSVAREIRTPFKEFKTPVLTKDELTVTPEFYLTFPNHGDWALVNTSSDTIYNYSADNNLTPIIVRTPSISTMETEVFLFPVVITDRYCFMRTQKKELNFTTFKGFPTTDLVYDKQEKALFEYTLYNADYTNKEQVSLGQKINGIVNQEIATCYPLEAPGLVEAYEKGQLTGKLKEIAAGLDEESNPVIMLVKYKK